MLPMILVVSKGYPIQLASGRTQHPVIFG